VPKYNTNILIILYLLLIMVESNFKVYGDDFGEYHPSTNRINIFLKKHETMGDIFSTITHEYLHYCISDTGEVLDDEQEERIIFIMCWAEEYC
jgi:hypothetical protein